MRLFCWCALVLASLIYRWTSAAPQSHLMTNRLRPMEDEREEQRWATQSPLFWTSKALNTLIRIASIMYQWIPPPQGVSTPRPMPSYLRPAKISFGSYDPYEYE